MKMKDFYAAWAKSDNEKTKKTDIILMLTVVIAALIIFSVSKLTGKRELMS